MPRLPGAETLGGLPSGRSGRPIATYDKTAIGRGIADMGAGIRQFGASLESVSAGWKENAALDADARFQQFKWEESKRYDETVRNVGPGQAAGFATGYIGDGKEDGYKARGKAFLATVPAEKKPEIAGKLFSFEQGLYGDALDFERKEQFRFADKALSDSLNNVFLPRAAAIAKLPADDPRKPEMMAEAEAELIDLIDKNPSLSAIEKDAKKAELREQFQTIFAESLSPEERETLSPDYEDGQGISLPGYWSGELSPYTVERADGLNTDLLRVVTRAAEIAEASGVKFTIGDHGGFRTQADQDALYAKGRTAPGGIVTNARVSRHQSGNAIDLWPLVNGKPIMSGNASDGRPQDYDVIAAAMRQASQELGIPVSPGPKWDRPHWQIGGGGVRDPFLGSRYKAPVNGGGATVVDRIIGVESGGNANAANPKSSALGAGQFIRGTWLTMIKTYRPDLMDGRSTAEVLALRTDPAIAREMVARYAEENARFLGARGIGATPGNVYLAHFLGPQGAAAVLNSAAGTPVASVLPDAVIAANGSILAGKTTDQVAAWAAAKMAGAKTGGWAGRLTAIPYDKRVRIAASAESDFAAAEKEREDQDRTTRLLIEREGDVLMREDKLTPEWLDENADLLGNEAYRRFSKALEPASTRVITDPKEYVKLLDLAEDDPEEAITEVRDAYTEGRVAKDVFNTILAKAERTLDGKTKGHPYVKQIRSYVNSALQPHIDATRAEHARFLDTRFIFDDWVEQHPDASREEVRAFADDLIKNQRRYIMEEKMGSLAIPKFAGVPNRRLLDETTLTMAKTKTADALKAGLISPAEAAEEAKLLQQWLDAVKQFGVRPSQ